MAQEEDHIQGAGEGKGAQEPTQPAETGETHSGKENAGEGVQAPDPGAHLGDADPWADTPADTTPTQANGTQSTETVGDDEQYQFMDDNAVHDQFEMDEEEPPEDVSGLQTAGGMAAMAGGVLAAVKTFSEERRPLFFAIIVVFSITVMYQFMKSPKKAEGDLAGMQYATKALPMKHGDATKGSSAAKKTASGDGGDLAHLQAMHSGMNEQLKAIKQVAHTNQTSMNTFNQAVRESKMHVSHLTQQSQQLVAELNRLNTEVSKLNAKVFPAAKSEPLVYSIQAIVPGRAWLTSNRGDSLTVNVGSQLPTYGMVRQINADAGLVFTSSGKLIHYSVDPNA